MIIREFDLVVRLSLLIVADSEQIGAHGKSEKSALPTSADAWSSNGRRSYRPRAEEHLEGTETNPAHMKVPC
jgi:hypothetical protein